MKISKAIKKYSLVMLYFFPVFLVAQNKTICYKESQEDMVNPERGFYIPLGTKASNFVVLDAEKLKLYRDVPQRSGHASYTVNVSLIYRGYELDTFKDKPLSVTFLANLQLDFDAVRKAGLKMIIRFAYTNTSHTGDCKDEYEICPPYGDAPRQIVLNHIRQLKPVLQQNADVIAVMQEGFIGIWGENYFTDYFGDASNAGAGKIADSSWRHRNELLRALLDALPKSRMVQVRTPQIKQKFVYGPSAPTTSVPLQQSVAFKNADQARIGFHNDCFLSGADDYGTFYDYGSSHQPRTSANKVLRKYMEADSKFTVVGGETCDDTFSPQNDCAPAGHAENEMRSMHYSYLNAAYNTAVNNDWDSSGCLYNIKRELGYRLVLRNAVLPLRLRKTDQLTLDFTLENVGYATMYNPRPVKIVFRNVETKKEYMVSLKADPRFWFSGKHHIREMVKLPARIGAGSFQIFLYLPDDSTTLAGRPEYAVQLANENMFEKITGYNDLQHIIAIK